METISVPQVKYSALLNIMPLAVESYTVDEGLPGSVVEGTISKIFKQLVGQCPVTVIKMGDVEINCLIDRVYGLDGNRVFLKSILGKSVWMKDCGWLVLNVALDYISLM